jgi:hypothetical protein
MSEVATCSLRAAVGAIAAESKDLHYFRKPLDVVS